jgi:hypothetical protein
MLSREDARLATGMKVSEILDIEAVDGGYKVTTHDGQSILLEETGEVSEPAEPEKDPEPAKKAPARGRAKA